MLDDLYQADTDAAINDLVRRPPAQKPQAAKFSAWSMLTAAPRGVLVGGMESGAMVPDLAEGIGNVFTRATVDFLPEPQGGGGAEFRKREKERAQGASSVEGDLIRKQSREFMPDPQTTHTAENLVFQGARFMSKAVAQTATLGPVAGAASLSVDEGLTAADELRQQGVDLETRTKVGAVVGVLSGVGAVLPVAGRNAVQTAALVAVGGPGSFIAQQAATRQILQDADYTKLADQIDPLDPVGLAVSTLVPAGFGAWAVRGAKLRDRVKPGDAPMARQDAVPARQGEQQNIPENIPRPTPDQVDAARVEMLTQHIESAGLHSAADARAAAMHLDAFARAMDDLSTGRRVDVSDLVPADRIQTARALDTFATRLDETRADLMAQAAMRAEPGAVRALQSELVDAQARMSEFEDPAAIKARAGELQQAERMSYKQALAQAKREFSAQADDVRARIARVEGLLQDHATGQQAFDALNILDRQAADVGRQRSQIDAPATAETPAAQAVREITATRQEAAANVQDAPQAATYPFSDRGNVNATEVQAFAAEQAAADARGAAPAGAAEQGGGVSRAGSAAPEATAVAARLAEVSQQFPDLTVQMDGMDAPMPLADFLAQVQREAMEGTDFDLGGNDAPLMQVAANCFLLNG